jgi:glutathione S-transferase
MGSGRYSKKLDYKEWHKFNSAQRVHQNYLEQESPMIFAVLIAGIMFAKVAACCGFAFVAGRLLYAVGYMIAPKKRGPGALIGIFAFLIAAGCAVYSMVILGLKTL